MIRQTIWIARFGQVISLLCLLQGILLLFGLPEALMPLRVRLGSQT